MGLVCLSYRIYMIGFLFLLVIALLPAWIASEKGRSFVKWYIYGVLLWIIALLHSLLIKGSVIKCPKCLSTIDEKATVCKYCTHKITEDEKAEVMKARELKRAKMKKNVTIFLIVIAAYWLIFSVLLHSVLHVL